MNELCDFFYGTHSSNVSVMSFVSEFTLLKNYQPKQFLFASGSLGSWLCGCQQRRRQSQYQWAEPRHHLRDVACLLLARDWEFFSTAFRDAFLALLQGFRTVYTLAGFRMSSSAGDAISISIVSEIYAFFCPPARVIVRCVCGLDIPGCFAALLYKRFWII